MNSSALTVVTGVIAEDICIYDIPSSSFHDVEKATSFKDSLDMKKLHDGKCRNFPVKLQPSYFGCNDVSTGKRTWTPTGMLMPTDLSPWICQNACLLLNSTYRFFGLENNQYCNCGFAPENTIGSGCNKVCPSAPGYVCGGPKLQVTYQMVPSSKYTELAARTVVDKTVGGYAGCYSESAVTAALTHMIDTSYVPMPISFCGHFCNGRPYFAVTLRSECKCGSKPNATSAVANSMCDQTCYYDPGRICGSGDYKYFAVYKTPA